MKENSNKNSVKIKKRDKKIIIIFISAFLSLLLIFGTTLGIVLAVRNSGAVVKYKNVIMDGETVSYFESYYKYRYMSALSKSGVQNVRDTEMFWNTDSGNGKTYGEMLKEETKTYISSLMVANYLFNSYSNLTSSDRDMISDSIAATLEHKAEGDKGLFNTDTAKYGFGYDSYREAVKMLYKASVVKNIIYGQSGEKLQSYPALAGEYLSEYTHVKLLFIRTETTFVLDDDGNRIVGNDGNDVIRLLTEDEKAQRQKLLAEIRGYIDAIGTDAGIEMGSVMFDHYLDSSDEGDRDMHTDGYYFHEKSDFTAEFSEVFSDIVEKSYAMELDSFDEVKLDFGVCFIYKYAPTSGAYAQKANEMCFTDFYANARDALFEKSLTELSPAVVFTDKYNSDSVISRPYNYIYYPVF